MQYHTSLAVLISLACAGSANAHFHLLLPSQPAARKGESITLTCRWGHPFEHQMFDALRPLSLTVHTPDGKKSELVQSLERFDAPAGAGSAAAWRLRYTPQARGDYLFVLRAPPVWMEEEREFFQDTVKVILHVQTQNGWDAKTAAECEWLPLTRPYGLLPGMVVQAQAQVASQPLAGALVEVEHYNPQPPTKLPSDELITRTARTDPNGTVTTTLTEAGWWCLTTSTSGGKLQHQGKSWPIRRRLTLWVFVDEPSAGRSGVQP